MDRNGTYRYVYAMFLEATTTTKATIRSEDRLQLLNARGGGLSRGKYVMPIDLIFFITERDYVQLNAYNDAESGCQAILAIVPKVYLGWRGDLYQNHGMLEFAGESWADGLGAFYPADKETLERHQFWSPSAIVRRLDEMYFEKQTLTPVKLQSVIDGVIEFRRQLADEQDPYNVSINPDWKRENRSGPSRAARKNKSNKSKRKVDKNKEEEEDDDEKEEVEEKEEDEEEEHKVKEDTEDEEDVKEEEAEEQWRGSRSRSKQARPSRNIPKPTAIKIKVDDKEVDGDEYDSDWGEEDYNDDDDYVNDDS
ncbi:MAG: hypothetical protein Q9180_008356 [Flavoplaca navasiana]